MSEIFFALRVTAPIQKQMPAIKPVLIDIKLIRVSSKSYSV